MGHEDLREGWTLIKTWPIARQVVVRLFKLPDAVASEDDPIVRLIVSLKSPEFVIEVDKNFRGADAIGRPEEHDDVLFAGEALDLIAVLADAVAQTRHEESEWLRTKNRAIVQERRQQLETQKGEHSGPG